METRGAGTCDRKPGIAHRVLLKREKGIDALLREYYTFIQMSNIALYRKVRVELLWKNEKR